MPWVLAISILLLGYIYAGYPACIWALSRFFARPVRKGPAGVGVSVLIAAHNEAESLPRKLENLLELAKDEPIREIWIGLDGCSDVTSERIRSVLDRMTGFTGMGRMGGGEGVGGKISTFNIQHSTFTVQVTTGEPISELQRPKSDEQPNACNRPPTTEVHILGFEQRRGKAAVLNDLMAAAGQPILVMMDARQRVEPGAISKLLENFADERVGVVSGALVYESADGGAQKGAESYWGYEKFIRECESCFWAVPGATGALYAIRKDLCAPIPENSLVDDVLIPMRAILKGFRCLFEPSARVFDLPSARFRQEGLRKRRTLAGIWQMGHLEPRIFSVFSNPVWFQWISHKYLRLLTPFLIMMSAFSLSWMSWSGIRVAQWLLAGAFIVLLVSLLSFLGAKWTSSRIVGLLGAFFGVNWALLQAAWDAWSGKFEAQWKSGGG